MINEFYEVTNMKAKMLIPILILPLALSLGGCGEKAKQQHERERLKLQYQHAVKIERERQPHETERLRMKHDQEIETLARRHKFLSDQQKEDNKHAQETQKVQNAHDEVVKIKRYEMMEPVLQTFIIYGGIALIFVIISGISRHIANKKSETSMHNAMLHEKTTRIRIAKEIEAQKYAIDQFIANKEKFSEKETEQIIAAKLEFDRNNTPEAIPDST